MNSTKINNFLSQITSEERNYIQNKLKKKLIIYYFNGEIPSTIYYDNNTTIQHVIDKIILEKQSVKTYTNTFSLFSKGNETQLLNTTFIHTLSNKLNGEQFNLFALQTTILYLLDVFVLLQIYSLYDYSVIYNKHKYNIYDIINEYEHRLNKKNVTNIYNSFNEHINLINIYPNLEKFDLNEIFQNIHEFTRHPDDIIQYYKSFKIQHFHIVNFPKNLFKALQLQNLEYINISSCNLIEIPEDIFKLKQLMYLDLSVNNLNYIPKQINQLINLKEFIIFKNIKPFDIKYLIEFMIQNTNLLCFGLYNNNLIYNRTEVNFNIIMYNEIKKLLKQYNIESYNHFLMKQFKSYSSRTKK
jgi:hypothetical protein